MVTENNVTSLSFEEALKELEEIVRKLESSGQALDTSIALYERGTALKAHCEAKLKEARLKVDKIVAQTEGGFEKESFASE